jgi:hypothetical protein
MALYRDLIDLDAAELGLRLLIAEPDTAPQLVSGPKLIGGGAGELGR